MDRTLDSNDRTDIRTPVRTIRGTAPSGRSADRRTTVRVTPATNLERTADVDRPHGLDPSLQQRDRIRQPIAGGRQTYELSADERATLADLGRFRVIASQDLTTLRYGGRDAQRLQDMRSLMAQGLVQRKTVWTGRPRVKETYYSLTPSGKPLSKREVDSVQNVYAGFVKPAELRHDAAIYRVYHREAEQIAREGGRIRRVVLDFELKKKAFSPLAKARTLPAAEYAKRQAEIARENGLKVVNGHIALPDLRIEYETRLGGSAQVDLEVATESYHGSHAAEKAAAGFRIYAAHDTAARLTAALEEREITAEILSL